MFSINIILGYCVILPLAADPNPSIIVVGSGPAGVAAATRLLEYNFTNLIILEAENRIGGRINSIKFGDAYVDMGAEFCHGEKDNIVYSLVKNLSVLRHSIKNEHFYYSNGEVIDERIGEKILLFAESLEGGEEPLCENVKSIGECFDIQFTDFANSTKDPIERSILLDSSNWIDSHLCAFDSPFDINDLKISSTYKKCEGDLHMNWGGLGYKTILEVMMRKYPEPENSLPMGDKIFCNTTVTRIVNWHSGNKVTVSTANGTQYETDHVIFTPSVGVLKANQEQLFHRHLPNEKVQAINNIGFGAILKIQMHFPRRWWNEDAKWIFIWKATDRHILKQKKLEWLLNIAKVIQAHNNSKVLTAWYAGKYIPLIETLPEEEVLNGQSFLFNKFFGRHFNVTTPDKIIRSTWYSNLHFRGTYAYESTQGHADGGGRFPEVLGRPLVNEDNKPTVLFAGEATHPYYFSTVHGAIESGYREADRLIQFYNTLD